jgi:hypothetical protein
MPSLSQMVRDEQAWRKPSGRYQVIVHVCVRFGHLREGLAAEVAWSHLRMTIVSSGPSLANVVILAIIMPHCIGE